MATRVLSRERIRAADPEMALTELIKSKHKGSRRNHDNLSFVRWNANENTYRRVMALSYRREVWARELAAEILGEFGIPKRFHKRQCIERLTEMLDTETDPAIVESVIFAHNFQDSVDNVLDAILAYAVHKEQRVRFAVACSLFASDDSRGIPILLQLMKDRSSRVRDWATFAMVHRRLNVLRRPEVTELLLALLRDRSRDVRSEAAFGLARLKNPLALDAACQLLANNCGGIYEYIFNEFPAAQVLAKLDEHNLTQRIAGWEEDPGDWVRKRLKRQPQHP